MSKFYADPKTERPTSLALAIMEAGRINKTVYLLNFLSDEGYLRRIFTQLNRTEKRHDLARVICYGRRGEIRNVTAKVKRISSAL